MAIDSVPTVTTSLNYLVPPDDGSRVYQTTQSNLKIGDRRNNFTIQSEDVVIENVRGKEASFTLDTAGFQFFHHPAKHASFQNDEEIINEYYPESIELIKELTGASKVVLFDHSKHRVEFARVSWLKYRNIYQAIRRRRPGEIEDNPQKRQPVAQAHVDQTAASATARVRLHLPSDEAEQLLQRRFQIVNLWRPISHPALDWPLAVCDFRSVDVEKDLVPIALVYPDREGETYGVKYNPNHRWKYLRGMMPDEFVLLKCFDSVQDGSVAILTPHTGFKDPSTPADAPLRESVELRALVFY